MSLYTTIAPITITCNKRLTPYLEQEVLEMGFTIDEVFVTGIKLQGTLNDCIRLNLNLRCGSQVLFSLDQFEARNPEDIYDNLTELVWEDLLPEPGYFSVTSNVQHDTINNSMYANLKVKDAIVDRLRAKRGTRPQTGPELTGAVVHLFWKQDYAEIFLDTTGDSIARHGYRKIPGRAPMLEALAAATLFASRWDRVTPLLNPMCGSGTLAIEAALMASNRRPGLFRSNYAFMHLQGYNDAVYQKELKALKTQVTEVTGLTIIATDHNSQAIVNAQKNAIAAGVDHLITFDIGDFATTPVPPGPPGIMIINPEYGERLGDLSELEETYARIGDFMKQRLKGYYGYVFTGNRELAKKIGLKAKRRIEFYNSTIDCRLLEYELYAGSNSREKVTPAGDPG